MWILLSITDLGNVICDHAVKLSESGAKSTPGSGKCVARKNFMNEQNSVDVTSEDSEWSLGIIGPINA